MKMMLDDVGNLNLIGAYAPGDARIHGETYTTSLLVWPRRIVTDCPVTSIDMLTPADLAPIVEGAPEVLVIGTGERQRFPDQATLAPLMTARIGYEVMDNAAACRTFNVLLAEGRHAALLLLTDPDAN